MAFIENLFNRKDYISELRANIYEGNITLRFKHSDNNPINLSLDQLTDKLNEFFGLKFFSPELLKKLDGIPLNEHAEIINSNDMNEKEQSVLEFLCDLIFIINKNDNLNITKEQHHSMRKKIIHREIPGLLSEIRHIAYQHSTNQKFSDVAYGLFEVKKSDNLHGKLQDWLENKNLLNQIKDILIMIERGELESEFIPYLKNLDNIDDLSTINFPQLKQGEADSYRTKIRNVQSFINSCNTDCTDLYVTSLLNKIAKYKRILHYILNFSHTYELEDKLNYQEITLLKKIIGDKIHIQPGKV